MFHYNEPVQDRQGNGLVGYFIGVVTPDPANPTGGSEATIYADANGTAIVSVSGVDNRAKVDEDGMVSFYVTEGSYHVDLYGPDGTTQLKRYYNIPMLSAAVNTTAAASVGSRSLMAAISSPVSTQSVYLSEAGREGNFAFSTANHATDVTNDPQQGIYVAPSSDTTGASGAWVRKFTGPANVTWFGVSASATDNAAAFTAAFSNASKAHIPAGTFIVSALSIPANTEITTAGFNTIIKRQSGIADGTRIVNINGSNVTIGDIAVQGLIASETGEQNHGVFIQGNTANGNLQNITIGNVKATDIRGDAVYVGSANSKTVSQIKIGQIYANNCWRNGLSVADSVTGLDVESVYEVACGQHTVDIEPNAAATGPGIRIGYIRGRHLSLAGSGAAINGVDIGTADLDLTYGSNSTPANPVDHKIGSQASGTDNAVVVCGVVGRIGRLKANGYTGQAMIAISGAITSRLNVDLCEITNCCTSDTVYNCFILSGTQAELQIGQLKATTTLSTHTVLSTCVNSRIGKASVPLVTGSHYMASCTDCETGELVATVSGAGNGGIIMSACTRTSVLGGSLTGDQILFNCASCTIQGVTATMVTGNITGTVANNTIARSTLSGTFSQLRYYTSATTAAMIIDASGNVTASPPASVTPANNGQMTFELTNDTTLKVKVKGSDGTVRSTTLTLA